MQQKKFLTAEWRKLIMANYIIDPLSLQKFLPAKTEIDLWKGNCYVSLVGFMFQNVRLKGTRIPCHVNFPEVNLRFYVRHKENNEWKRGVVFIHEIVPKPAITFIANTIFKEHYVTLPMRYTWIEEKDHFNVSYQWKKKNKWNRIEVINELTPHSLQAGSEEEFITEHFWGYAAASPTIAAEYQVAHPRWEIYTVNDYTIDCDFSDLFGENFKMLTNKKPDSVFLAEGSPITVFQKKII